MTPSRSLLLTGALALGCLLPQLASANACASNATGNWGDSGSWTSCGGTTPQSADTVTIANGHTITLNTTATVLSVTINVGGTLTEDSGSRTLSVATGWTNNGTFTPEQSTVKFIGTLTFQGNTSFNNLTIDPNSASNFTVTLTGYTATVDGALTFNNSSTGLITLTGGTIAANGNIAWEGSVTSASTTALTVTGTGDQTLTGSGATNTTGLFVPFTINKASGTLFLAGTIRTFQNWTWTQGTVDATTNNSTVIFAGTLTITGSHTLNNVRFDSTSSTTRTYTFAGGTTLSVAGTLTLDNSSTGLIVFTGGTIAANGNIAWEGSVTSASTTALTVTGTGDQTLTGSGATNTTGLFVPFTINKASGTLFLAGTIRTFQNWTYTQGTVDATTYDSTVVFAGDLSISGSHTLDNVRFDPNNSGGRTYTIAGGTTLTVAGTLSVENTNTGGIILSGGSISAQGNVNFECSVASANTTTLTVTGTGDQTFTGSGATNTTGLFIPFTISKTSGTLFLAGTIRTNQPWTWTQGTVDATTNNSSIIFVSSSVGQTMSGSHTLNNVRFDSNNNSARTFTLTAATTLTVAGTLTLDNSSTGLITLAGGTIAANGNVDWEGSVASGNSTALTVTGTGDQTLTGSGATNTTGLFTPFTINKASGTLFLVGTIRTFNNWTWTQGTVDATTNDSTVIFANSLTISGSHTLDNVTFNPNTGSSKTDTFSDGTVLTVAGTLTMDNSGAGVIILTGGNIAAQGDIVWDGLNFGVSNTTVLEVLGTGDQTLTASNATNTTGDFVPFTINKASGTLFLSGTIRTTKNWTYTQGTVDATTNNSTVVFGERSLAISGSHTLNNVTFHPNGSTSRTYTLSNTLTVVGTLTTENGSTGTITLSGGAIEAEGAINWEGTIASATSTTTLTIDGTGIQTLTLSGSTATSGIFVPATINKTGGSLTVSGILRTTHAFTHTAGTVDWTTNDATLSLASTLTFTPGSATYDNIVIDTAGTVTQSGNLSLAGNWTNNGSYTTGATSVTFTGAGTSTVITGGTTATKDFQDFTVNKSGAGLVQLSTNGLDVDGTLAITAGTLDLNGQNLSTTTTLTNAGILKLTGDETLSATPTNATGSTVTYSATSGSRAIKDWTYKNLTISGAGGTFTDGTSRNIEQALTVTAGTFTPSATLTVSGTGTVNGGTLSAESATLDFNGNVVISSGTFTAPTGTTTIAGNFTHSSGTFTHNSGTVTFDGANQSVTGSSTFNNFSKTDSSDNSTDLVLTFDNTATQTIAGLLTLQGTDTDDRVNLVSDSPSTRWELTANGTFAVSWVDVTDSDASGGTEISQTNTVNGGNNLNWGFDSTAPTVTVLSPADNATGVLVTANIVLTFDEDVRAGTGTLTIKRTSNDSTVETITVSGALLSGNGTTELTLNPATTLSGSTSYYVTYSDHAFKDTTGNHAAAVTSTTAWNFTTADVGAPTVQTLSPADNATGVSVTANLVITFDEAVRAGTGTLSIKRTSNDSTVETITVSGALLSGNGTTELTLNPATTLSGSTSYYVTYSDHAFKDTSGNHAAAVTSTTAWNFTTADVGAPAVSTLSPADGAIDVAITANLVITFDENVTAVAAKNITIKKTSDDSTVETIVANGGQVSISSAEVTINPSASLANNISYYVLIDSGAFEDTSSNDYAGIASTTAWNFTTVAAASSSSSAASSSDSSSSAPAPQTGGHRGSTTAMAKRVADAHNAILAKYQGKQDREQKIVEEESPALVSEEEQRRRQAALKVQEAALAQKEQEAEAAARRRENRILDRIARGTSSLAALQREKEELQKQYAERREERFADALKFQEQKIAEHEAALRKDEQALAQEQEENRKRHEERLAERKALEQQQTVVESSPSDDTPASPEMVAQRRGRLLAYVGDDPIIYGDVPLDAWFTPFVSYVLEEGVATGYKDDAGKPTGEFGVGNSITLAETLKMALEAAHQDLTGLPPPRNKSARGTWASAYIAKAEEMNLAVITPETDVNIPAARGEVVRIILEIMDFPIGKTVSTFSDVPAEHPHTQAIALAAFNGFIEGDKDANGALLNRFRPDDPVNRAEVAKIISLVREVAKK